MEKYNPKGVCKTVEYIEEFTYVEESADDRKVKLFSEAQTSGGLLAAIKPKHAKKAIKALHAVGDTAATIIGEVCKRDSDNDYFLHVK